MPELPDVVVYVRRLRALVQGQVLERVRLKSTFLIAGRLHRAVVEALRRR